MVKKSIKKENFLTKIIFRLFHVCKSEKQKRVLKISEFNENLFEIKNIDVESVIKYN